MIADFDREGVQRLRPLIELFLRKWRLRGRTAGAERSGASWSGSGSGCCWGRLKAVRCVRAARAGQQRYTATGVGRGTCSSGRRLSRRRLIRERSDRRHTAGGGWCVSNGSENRSLARGGRHSVHLRIGDEIGGMNGALQDDIDIILPCNPNAVGSILRLQAALHQCGQWAERGGICVGFQELRSRRPRLLNLTEYLGKRWPEIRSHGVEAVLHHAAVSSVMRGQMIGHVLLRMLVSTRHPLTTVCADDSGRAGARPAWSTGIDRSRRKRRRGRQRIGSSSSTHTREL